MLLLRFAQQPSGPIKTASLGPGSFCIIGGPNQGVLVKTGRSRTPKVPGLSRNSINATKQDFSFEGKHQKTITKDTSEKEILNSNLLDISLKAFWTKELETDWVKNLKGEGYGGWNHGYQEGSLVRISVITQPTEFHLNNAMIHTDILCKNTAVSSPSFFVSVCSLGLCHQCKMILVNIFILKFFLFSFRDLIFEKRV